MLGLTFCNGSFRRSWKTISFLPEVQNWIRWILALVICESYHDCLNQHFFYLSSPEKSKRKCKVFWLTCIKDIRMQKQNRIKLRLNHQEKLKNLFSEMLSQDMERVDNMDMMPQGVLTFRLFDLFNLLWLSVDHSKYCVGARDSLIAHFLLHKKVNPT